MHLAVRHAPVPLWARVDGAQFQQLVVNLCTNGWQALGDDSGEVRVSLDHLTLTAQQAALLQLEVGDHVCLQVADNGQGMDEAVRSRIFEPFFTTKPLGQGTGLGLAVVHGVVTENGGSIRVESEPGRGTCISVYLPLIPEPVSERAAEPSKAATDIDGLGGHVLYVDDDEVVSLTAAALLSNAGFAVTCAGGGQAALSAMRDMPGGFDAVVTDFNMPGMSGLAIAEAVLRDAPGTAVIITTGLITDDLRVSAGHLGVREVLPKEDLLERLVDAVRRALAPP